MIQIKELYLYCSNQRKKQFPVGLIYAIPLCVSQVLLSHFSGMLNILQEGETPHICPSSMYRPHRKYIRAHSNTNQSGSPRRFLRKKHGSTFLLRNGLTSIKRGFICPFFGIFNIWTLEEVSHFPCKLFYSVFWTKEV